MNGWTISAWEAAGSILGIIGVVLMIRQHLLAWPVGLVQVAIYAWIFFTAKLYSDALLQIIFFVLLVYGWWRWWRGVESGHERHELPVTSLSPGGRLFCVVLGLLATAGWGEFMRRHTDAALPHWDAFILAFSMIAQWMQARKKIENWAVWIVVNTVAVGVYLSKDLYFTAVLYAVFLGLAVAGHVSWRRHRMGGGS
ncbi:MAG: nicotinamide mononucleotide transporter [Opitutaceae bacterium]|nr:nicotinamide mononucleotide transporter [Opitutaceae bacterium]